MRTTVPSMFESFNKASYTVLSLCPESTYEDNYNVRIEQAVDTLQVQYRDGFDYDIKLEVHENHEDGILCVTMNSPLGMAVRVLSERPELVQVSYFDLSHTKAVLVNNIDEMLQSITHYMGA